MINELYKKVKRVGKRPIIVQSMVITNFIGASFCSAIVMMSIILNRINEQTAFQTLGLLLATLVCVWAIQSYLNEEGEDV